MSTDRAVQDPLTADEAVRVAGQCCADLLYRIHTARRQHELRQARQQAELLIGLLQDVSTAALRKAEQL